MKHSGNKSGAHPLKYSFSRMAHEILDTPEKLFGSFDAKKVAPLKVENGEIVDESILEEPDEEDSPV